MREIFLILLLFLTVSCGTTKHLRKVNTSQQDTTIVYKMDTSKIRIQLDSTITSTDTDNTIIEEEITEQITETKTDSTSTTVTNTKREIKRTISKDRTKTDTTIISKSINENKHIQIDSTNYVNKQVQEMENKTQKIGFERVLYPIALIILLLIILLITLKKVVF